MEMPVKLNVPLETKPHLLELYQRTVFLAADLAALKVRLEAEIAEKNGLQETLDAVLHSVKDEAAKAHLTPPTEAGEAPKKRGRPPGAPKSAEPTPTEEAPPSPAPGGPEASA